MEVTIGGERLGAGKKNKVYLHNYERSTHDLGYVWRSTMASGTLVPFMTEVALPGDTFDIDLVVDALTHPTIGPLFGTYKVQLDVFQIPIRLYQAQLHMNMLGIGRDMTQVKFPVLTMSAPILRTDKIPDNQQINPSCIFSYLGIRGVGYNPTTPTDLATRSFNAIPYLGYWDIYKNYYANKQEEIGAVIHKDVNPMTIVLDGAAIVDGDPNPVVLPFVKPAPGTEIYQACLIQANTTMNLSASGGITEASKGSDILVGVQLESGAKVYYRGSDLWDDWDVNVLAQTMTGRSPNIQLIPFVTGWGWVEFDPNAAANNDDVEPEVYTFPLVNIDNMRTALLQHANPAVPFSIVSGSPDPYGLPMQNIAQPDLSTRWSKLYGQEGLALKTYNSDLFNNWMNTDWIDGPDGISEVTKVDTSAGSFTIDELNLKNKIYNMLNRIALSGGSYDDWLDAVYTHERTRSAENPMYLGGLIQKLVFEEVIAQSKSVNQPLGTLAGRGRIAGDPKGGKIIAKIDEPSYLMGIVSITPKVDYSQGNKWDTGLQTMNDLHKPALDEIGFQDLITDQMAWWDTPILNAQSPQYKSAGKQPAWLNYMTNVNVVRGNFADASQQMFMVLNRRYGVKYTGAGNNIPEITDLTTYIDPTKFNHIFADTRRDAQNFWVQIGVGITARRKMSAKVIPNL